MLFYPVMCCPGMSGHEAAVPGCLRHKLAQTAGTASFRRDDLQAPHCLITGSVSISYELVEGVQAELRPAQGAPHQHRSTTLHFVPILCVCGIHSCSCGTICQGHCRVLLTGLDLNLSLGCTSLQQSTRRARVLSLGVIMCALWAIRCTQCCLMKP